MSDNNARLDNLVVITDRNRELKQKFGISYRPFSDLESMPTKSWLVKKFLGANELSCLYAPPSSCKSLLAADLAAHVAWGQDWMGRPVTQGGTLFVAIERTAVVMRRLAAFRRYHGVADLPLAVVSGALDLCAGKTAVMGIIECARRLEDESELKTALIVVDTVSRALAGNDENSSQAMGALVANILAIQEATKAHLLLTHHQPHEANRMRGHGALLAACDTTIQIEKNENSGAAIIKKSNDAAEGEKIFFNLESVELGPETTAPVVRQADATPPARPDGPKLTKNQQTMYSLLHDAGAGGLTTEQWNERGRAVDIGVKRKADLYDIRESLKSKNIVRRYGDRWNAC
jgi:RecA-family ATPase